MNRTLKEWRWSTGVCCLALSAVGTPSVSIAQSAEAPAAQNQPVDAAAKSLMAANGLFTRGLFKPAAESYADFLTQYPTHAQATSARYAMAVCQYKLRAFDKAAEQLRLVLADPKFDQRDEALAVLGHCELSQTHNDQALAAFDELLAKYPDSKHAQMTALNRGQVLYLSKKYPESAKACESFLAKYPDGTARADALYFLGLSQRAQNQNDDAVKTLGQLTQRYPDSSHQIDALLLTGQAFEAQGKLDEAIAAYRQMTATAPATRKADALYSLGVCLYKAGKYEDAATQLALLDRDFPASTYAKPARLQLGLAQLANNKTNDARAKLNVVVRDDPDHAAEARYGLAQCDIADKHYEQARQMLDELMRLEPPPANISQITLDHAVCTMELTQFRLAADELEKLRSQYSASAQIPEAAYREAFCLHKLGKFDQSHALCQQVAKLKAPDLADANNELDAEDLFHLEKYAEAEKQFADLTASTKDDAKRLRFSFRQGQCEYFAGNYPKSVALLQPIALDAGADRNPELQQASLLLGDALLQQGKDADAIAPLKHYLQISQTERQQAEYKLGMAQLHTTEVDAARAAFERAAQGPSDSPWVQRALFERGQIDLKAKRYEEAAGRFRRVLASNAPAGISGPAAYQLGWAEFEAKRFPQAAAAWKDMGAKYPKDKLAPDASFQQGEALHEARQLSEACDAFIAYASANPQGQYAVKARQLAAECLKELGKNDQAEKMLADLAGSAKGPEAAGVLFDLATSQQDAKESAAAEATYQRLLTEHPDDKLAPSAGTNLAILLYEDKKYTEAAALLEKVVSGAAADPKVLAVADYRLGLCYEKLSRPDKAAAMFAAYHEKGGGNDEIEASSLVHAGLAYAEDGKFDKAEQSLSEMLRKYPTHKDAPVAMLKLGEVQAEQQNYDGSNRTFAQFLQTSPKSEFVYRAEFGIGWATENQKKFDESRKAYQKVIAATNGETAARAQFQIGETYLDEGKFEQAIPALLAVDDVYKYPAWSARALFEAGRAFEQLKQNDQARKQYTDVVTKYKESPQASMAQDRLKSIAGS